MHDFVSGLFSYETKQLAQAKVLVKNLTDVDTQSVRKFNAVDGHVERLAIFASRKYGRQGPNWTTRYG